MPLCPSYEIGMPESDLTIRQNYARSGTAARKSNIRKDSAASTSVINISSAMPRNYEA
jgi:hypothetical protein